MNPRSLPSTQAPDTTPEAERVLLDLYRRLGPIGRLRKAGALGASLDALALRALRERFPSEPESRLRWRLATGSLAQGALTDSSSRAASPAEGGPP